MCAKQTTTNRHRVSRVLALLGVALLCLPILLSLMPNLEMSRLEARTAQAYHEVRRLRDQHADRAPRHAVAFSETDPWGTAYRLELSDDDQVRVVSAGPNTAFDAAGPESDDIYSDMPISPMEPFHTRRNWEWLVAISVTAIVWGVLATAYIMISAV